MGIVRNFFRKIKLGFTRRNENSLPYVSNEKKYGNLGEDVFFNCIKKALPDCQIKRNIIIDSDEGNAEIDCLLLYQNKLFAIEIKRWKGYISEQNGEILQRKVDKWTEEIHAKRHKSPFKQLGRAIYLLRIQNSSRAWINSVIFFEDVSAVNIDSCNVWFNKMDDLIKYIKLNGKESNYREAFSLFKKAVSADYLYSSSFGKSLHCIILDESINFKTDLGIVNRNNIMKIKIIHHWSYDELYITLKDNSNIILKSENLKIKVRDNGLINEYALSKLDYIALGER